VTPSQRPSLAHGQRFPFSAPGCGGPSPAGDGGVGHRQPQPRHPSFRRAARAATKPASRPARSGWPPQNLEAGRVGAGAASCSTRCPPGAVATPPLLRPEGLLPQTPTAQIYRHRLMLHAARARPTDLTAMAPGWRTPAAREVGAGNRAGGAGGATLQAPPRSTRWPRLVMANTSGGS